MPYLPGSEVGCSTTPARRRFGGLGPGWPYSSARSSPGCSPGKGSGIGCTLAAASGEVNSTVTDQAGVLARLEEQYAARPGAEVDHLDGLTVTHADWWFNVRPSNTEPLLRLNAEARDEATMVALRDEVLTTIRSGQ